MIRYSIRINLTDFIGTEQEEQIITTIYSIGEEAGKKIFLKLWYREGELTQEEVLEFVKRYSKMLEEIGTNIHIGEHEVWTQKSWCNLRKAGTKTSVDYRHEYMYQNPLGILQGLAMFRVLVLTVSNSQTPTAPPPPPKRENGGQQGYRVTIRKVSDGIQKQSLPEGETKNENRNSRVPHVDEPKKDS